MPILTKRQLIAQFNKGYLDEVAKELLRYGTIVRDVEWETPDGYYKGHSRVQHIIHKGYAWELHKLNGEILRLGYSAQDGGSI